MDLESKNATLQSELDSATPSSLLKRNKDPSSWLPTTPRYCLESHRNTVNCVAFHPIYSSVASGSDDCTIKIWDWELGELEMTLKGHTRPVLDVDYGGPRGSVLLASCSSDLSIRLWNPADEYKTIRTLLGHDHMISAVRFTPSGNALVSASRDRDMRIWDVTTGYCVRTVNGHSAWVRDVSFSFDGKFLLSTGDDMTARLWDLSVISNPEHKLTMLGHEHFNECCVIAPPASYQYLAPLAGSKESSLKGSAEFMATGSRDKTIKLYDSRGNCFLTLVGHDNWVRAVLFHPGGKYLLSASDDKTIRCWDLNQDGKCVRTVTDAHDSFITSLRWAPGVVKNTLAGGTTTDGSTKKNEGDSNVDIRCVVATAGWDCKLNIFAN
ncbi:hypothetical protein EYZ11_003889 [Aspergillus tanneri]|uniref:Mitochondrial division protein 1 n=1 Tax=Aspergillus tanneri TaxID=1220188 RepID=A0A4S3JLZ0_9EURO|nr:protein with putative role during mitosis [Aspergillus tanneri]KAA8645141.1 protein with putative role during mitosis [Aspergillus tanneri]THC96639.1 hypothetical protein EYZ11_003889 [Aspergillus tanneri]